MSTYTYAKLRTEAEEIRLVRLLPGKPDEEIAFNIFHSPLIPRERKISTTRLSLKEIQKTLPKGWAVFETLEGRYLFSSDEGPNSWVHPDDTYDRASYDLPEVSEVDSYEPKYESLSYTWGPPGNLVTVRVQKGSTSGGEEDAALQIGVNLASTLRHLRYPTRSRTLWVDAICINQADVHEREAQVKRMGTIFSLASGVVIWLGEEGNRSAHALSTLEYFGLQVEYTVDGFMADAPGADEPRWFSRSYPLPYDEETWTSLCFLFRRPWFRLA
jgi:hypothetical protein